MERLATLEKLILFQFQSAFSYNISAVALVVFSIVQNFAYLPLALCFIHFLREVFA